jgi:phage gp29-like protein
VPGAGQWILYTPYGRNRPWAEGKWRRLAFPWILKRFALEDRANMSQAHGTPTKVGRTPKGSTERQRTLFLSQLQALGKNGTLVLPEGWQLDLVESTSKAFEIFDGAIAWSDQALPIVLAGQVVTTQGSPGFSSGNVQERIVGDLIRFDAATLGNTLRLQSLVPLAWSWYDDGAAAPWPRWDTQRAPDKEGIARTIDILGRAVKELAPSLAEDGVRVDTRAMLEGLGVPLTAVEATRTQAQAPGAGIVADATLDTDDARREHAEALAEKMTALGISRCEHGRSNRCPLCGVERSRDVELGPDGEPAWAVAWRAV